MASIGTDVPSIMTAWRVQTGPSHARLDGRPLLSRLMAADVTVADVVRVQARLYGFLAVVEPGIEVLADWPSRGVDIVARRKVGLLRRDLATLDIDAPSLPLAPLPAIEGPAAAFGFLYVLEGSTLGGIVIARHLRRTIGLDPTTGAAYFGAYGERTQQMWATFAAAAERFAAESGAQDAMLAGAVAAFAALDDWIATAGQGAMPSTCGSIARRT